MESYRCSGQTLSTLQREKTSNEIDRVNCPLNFLITVDVFLSLCFQSDKESNRAATGKHVEEGEGEGGRGGEIDEQSVLRLR